MYAANPTMKDSPPTFKAKLNTQIEMQRLAIARYNWLKTQYRGTPEQIAELAKSGRIEAMASLDSMKSKINETLDAEAQKIRQQNLGIDDRTLQQHLRGVQNRTFGI